MSFTTFLEKELLDHVFLNAPYTAPTTLYLALFTAAPNEAGGGTEVSPTGTAYARQTITFASTAGNPSFVQNNAAVEFATATASYGTVTHVAIMDAMTAGNMLVYAELTTPKTIDSGDVFRLPTNNLTINLE